MAIALEVASPDFSRKLAGMQVVCYGYDGQKHCRQNRERDRPCGNRAQQGPLAVVMSVHEPQSPKGNCDRQPSEIE
jgi:hypothetical protein